MRKDMGRNRSRSRNKDRKRSRGRDRRQYPLHVQPFGSKIGNVYCLLNPLHCVLQLVKTDARVQPSVAWLMDQQCFDAIRLHHGRHVTNRFRSGDVFCGIAPAHNLITTHPVVFHLLQAKTFQSWHPPSGWKWFVEIVCSDISVKRPSPSVSKRSTPTRKRRPHFSCPTVEQLPPIPMSPDSAARRWAS